MRGIVWGLSSLQHKRDQAELELAMAQATQTITQIPEHAFAVRAAEENLVRAELSIKAYLSDRILSEAARLDIDVPPPANLEYWDVELGGSKFLNVSGRFYLRTLIDQEKARRFEVKTLWVTKFWIPLLAAGIGIIGALTGLVAVLQHKK
jgi:hypothetical protein